jgi:hypothetical protein
VDEIVEELKRQGFSMRSGDAMRRRGAAWWRDWARLAASWDALCRDGHMGDGGRYRKRRHAVFTVAGGDVRRQPHQPHYQALQYNPLNGGRSRWFAPVTRESAQHPVMAGLLAAAASIFEALEPADGTPWHVEMHQFRIEAGADFAGLPAPEGVHRDGVDGVLIMLVGRSNVVGGVTRVYGADGRMRAELTLAEPGDALFLDDRAVLHGVTPVTPLDAAVPAVRDALVVTYRRKRREDGNLPGGTASNDRRGAKGAP